MAVDHLLRHGAAELEEVDEPKLRGPAAGHQLLDVAVPKLDIGLEEQPFREKTISSEVKYVGFGQPVGKKQSAVEWIWSSTTTPQ